MSVPRADSCMGHITWAHCFSSPLLKHQGGPWFCPVLARCCPSICPSIYPSLHPCIHHCTMHLSLYRASILPPIHASTHPSLHLVINRYIHSSTHPFMYPSLHHPCIHSSPIHSSSHPCTHPSIHPCTHVSTHLCIVHLPTPPSTRSLVQLHLLAHPQPQILRTSEGPQGSGAMWGLRALETSPALQMDSEQPNLPLPHLIPSRPL